MRGCGALGRALAAGARGPAGGSGPRRGAAAGEWRGLLRAGVQARAGPRPTPGCRPRVRGQGGAGAVAREGAGDPPWKASASALR